MNGLNDMGTVHGPRASVRASSKADPETELRNVITNLQIKSYIETITGEDEDEEKVRNSPA